MKEQTECSVLDCEKPTKSRTYCNIHYRKFVFLPTHPLYAIWATIVHKQRSVAVCEQWRHSYRTFVADIGPRPSPRHSLDRINKLGDYEPGNVQWSTSIQRTISRPIRITNSSGITGVYYHKKKERWHATITINKRRHHLGLYKTLPAAARARYLAEARYTV